MSCVIDFSFLVICVLLILLNSIKLPQSVVEVDLVLFFSILYNLLIYSGNFYTIQVCQKTVKSSFRFLLQVSGVNSLYLVVFNLDVFNSLKNIPFAVHNNIIQVSTNQDFFVVYYRYKLGTCSNSTSCTTKLHRNKLSIRLDTRSSSRSSIRLDPGPSYKH